MPGRPLSQSYGDQGHIRRTRFHQFVVAVRAHERSSRRSHHDHHVACPSRICKTGSLKAPGFAGVLSAARSRHHRRIDPAFFVGRNRDGFWLARDAKGESGGVFLFRSSALTFARRASGQAGCAMIFPSERFELDVENEQLIQQCDELLRVGRGKRGAGPDARYVQRDQRRARSGRRMSSGSQRDAGPSFPRCGTGAAADPALRPCSHECCSAQ